MLGCDLKRLGTELEINQNKMQKNKLKTANQNSSDGSKLNNFL